MAAGESTVVRTKSHGLGIVADILHDVSAKQISYVNGLVGLAINSGASGDKVTVDVGQQVLHVDVGGSITPSAGDILYLDRDEITGHSFNVAAFTLTSGANTVEFGRVIADKATVNNGNYVELVMFEAR